MSNGRWKFVAGCILFLTLNESANACFSADQYETVFYKTPPTQPDDLIVARISITRIIAMPTDRYRTDLGVPVGSSVAEASVIQIFKGDMPSNNVTIVARGFDCDYALKASDAGIVVGRFQRNPQGRPQLLLIPHPADDDR